MLWEITVVIEDGEQIGNISARWTDPDTSLGVFSYSRRSRVSVEAADAFIAETIAARDAWQISQANNNAKSAWALDRLNLADPKVV